MKARQTVEPINWRPKLPDGANERRIPRNRGPRGDLGFNGLTSSSSRSLK